MRADLGPGADERHEVVASGHDDELLVLWLRLDAVPGDAWAAAFDLECAVADAPFVRHGHHLLCTATPEDRRRLTKAGRRLVGAANGRLGRPVGSAALAS